jgi:hypothetical protein
MIKRILISLIFIIIFIKSTYSTCIKTSIPGIDGEKTSENYILRHTRKTTVKLTTKTTTTTTKILTTKTTTIRTTASTSKTTVSVLTFQTHFWVSGRIFNNNKISI